MIIVSGMRTQLERYDNNKQDKATYPFNVKNIEQYYRKKIIIFAKVINFNKIYGIRTLQYTARSQYISTLKYSYAMNVVKDNCYTLLTGINQILVCYGHANVTETDILKYFFE